MRSDVPLLDVRQLVVEYPVGRPRRPFRAVDAVDLTVAQAQTVGLVGESGAGKTTLARAILGLTPVTDGTITFGGTDITRASHRVRRGNSADLQAVFQDPYSSLNPTRTIGQSLGETLRRRAASDSDTRVSDMLDRVGLTARDARRYPTEFSGGQRQRIAIARALLPGPRLVVCDEPVSALDLSVQAQILNLLRELQGELGVSFLFVSHDLAVVRHVSHRIVVLYRGQVMEEGDAVTVHTHPAHPYTRALLAAAPVPDPNVQRRRRAQRRRLTPTRPTDGRHGCPFAPRCPYAIAECRDVRPELEATSENSTVACIRWRDIDDAPCHPAATANTPRRQRA